MKFYYQSFYNKGIFKESGLIKAIYTAWNIEADLYIWENNEWQLIFSPSNSNKFNSNLFAPYGYKMIDGYEEREIIDLETDGIVKYDWAEVQQLI